MVKRGNELLPQKGVIETAKASAGSDKPIGDIKTVEVATGLEKEEIDAAPPKEKEIDPIDFLIELLYRYGPVSIDFIAENFSDQLKLDRFAIIQIARTKGGKFIDILELPNSAIGFDLTIKGYARAKNLRKRKK